MKTSTTDSNSAVHSFSRSFAKDHGYRAAILAKFIGYKVRRAKKVTEGKQRYYNSAEKLTRQLPYLNRSTINELTNRLAQEGVLEITNHNKKRYDKTKWFTMSSEHQKAVEKDLVYFRVADAVKYGIVEAVILQNIRYWITENRQKQPGYEWHTISAAELSKLLPFSASTIRKALGGLVGKALEQKRGQGLNQAKQYRFINESDLSSNDAKQGETSNLDKGDPKPAAGESKLEIQQSNPAMQQSNLVTYTHLKEPLIEPSETINRPHYIEAPAAPSPECAVTQTEIAQDDYSWPGMDERVKDGNVDDVPEDFFEYVQQLFQPMKKDSQLRDTVLKIMKDFILSQNLDVLRKLTAKANEWQLYERLEPMVSQFLDSFPAQIAEDVRIWAKKIGTALMTQAYMHLQDYNYCPGNDVGYTLHMELRKRLKPFYEAAERKREEARQKAAEEERARVKALEDERQQKFASPDQDKEDVAALSAGQKKNVFRNAVISKNHAGIYLEGDNLTTGILEASDSSFDAAHEFFKANPDVSVATVLEVLGKCIDAGYREPSVAEGEHDPLFHARKGCNLNFFFPYLAKIVEETGMMDTIGNIEYPPKDKLFAKSLKKKN